MPFTFLPCPSCGAAVKSYLNPIPTVDIIIEVNEGIILIERRNEPFGWALPGGFVDYGETLEAAARREALEETGMEISDLCLLGCYSDPSRDPRQHTITTVFVATGNGNPKAGDDARQLAIYPTTSLPEKLCFDHGMILNDYKKMLGIA